MRESSVHPSFHLAEVRYGIRGPFAWREPRRVADARRNLRWHPLQRRAVHVAGWRTAVRDIRGLSKVPRACGFRVGWATLSGSGGRVDACRESIQLLASLRLCPNVPAPWAVEPALTGPDKVSALTAPGGRLHESRRRALEGIERVLERMAEAKPARVA